MSARVIAMLARDSSLFDRFKADPLATLKVIEEMTGSKAASRVSVTEIELIKSLTREEFELFYGVIDKMKALNIPNFRL